MDYKLLKKFITVDDRQISIPFGLKICRQNSKEAQPRLRDFL